MARDLLIKHSHIYRGDVVEFELGNRTVQGAVLGISPNNTATLIVLLPDFSQCEVHNTLCRAGHEATLWLGHRNTLAEAGLFDRNRRIQP